VPGHDEPEPGVERLGARVRSNLDGADRVRARARESILEQRPPHPAAPVARLHEQPIELSRLRPRRQHAGEPHHTPRQPHRPHPHTPPPAPPPPPPHPPPRHTPPPPPPTPPPPPGGPEMKPPATPTAPGAATTGARPPPHPSAARRWSSSSSRRSSRCANR